VSNTSNVPIRYAWPPLRRCDPLSAAGLATTIRDVRRLEYDVPVGTDRERVLNGVAMRTGLLGLLVAHEARWASASAILTVVALGPAAVAVAALALVATLAARRRRPRWPSFAGEAPPSDRCRERSSWKPL
jgi:hypothetical protein